MSATRDSDTPRVSRQRGQSETRNGSAAGAPGLGSHSSPREVAATPSGRATRTASPVRRTSASSPARLATLREVVGGPGRLGIHAGVGRCEEDKPHVSPNLSTGGPRSTGSRPEGCGGWAGSSMSWPSTSRRVRVRSAASQWLFEQPRLDLTSRLHGLVTTRLKGAARRQACFMTAFMGGSSEFPVLATSDSYGSPRPSWRISWV